MDRLLKQGFRYVVDVDLKSYFDTIPHDKLLAELRKQVADGRVLNLIEAFLKAGIMEGLRCWTPESGGARGAVLSPLLSNIYLNDLDHLMVREGFAMTRFEFFQHSHRTTFPELDAWIRMRPRSILRKRAHRRGRGRDHPRWPNALFVEQGLFSLKAAHASAAQSSSR